VSWGSTRRGEVIRGESAVHQQTSRAAGAAIGGDSWRGSLTPPSHKEVALPCAQSSAWHCRPDAERMVKALDPDLVNTVIELVKEGGQSIVTATAGYNTRHLGTHAKTSIGDLVTTVDVMVQNRLVSGLRQLTPDASFIGEEELDVGPITGPEPDFEEPPRPLTTHGNGLTWIIDPVDGTTNMVHGLSYSSISVALYDDHEPLLGVTHNPFTNVTCYAIPGGGAFERTDNSPSDRRLRVSGTREMSLTLISFGLPYDRSRGPSIFSAAAEIFKFAQDLRRSGSIVLDLAAVARGHFDGHIELISKPWDLGAVSIIVTQAGGVLTDWSGNQIDWMDTIQGSSVLASNGWIHQQLLEMVAPYAPQPPLR